ncbi:hypothetical protein THASP1DRAFT_29000 [Thamnocephalis sphaerospora]|uniref:Uncharacterized protein n=1 Tax=Thamnocephalis sphaerospora TaxID=78915 RepID=A0A4P9XSU0_9FUNG|nr:hypothetical protein THASP1DRAFT_29000 [Thamnocephalis sphaerospora]|eukprot:RKP09203.1 hypothetical protein THASP1DRAFT_29000 [Thamnocephalis sphaerospora]
MSSAASFFSKAPAEPADVNAFADNIEESDFGSSEDAPIEEEEGPPKENSDQSSSDGSNIGNSRDRESDVDDGSVNDDASNNEEARLIRRGQSDTENLDTVVKSTNANMIVSKSERRPSSRKIDHNVAAGLRLPKPLPEHWIQMNRLKVERVRQEEQKLVQVISDVNQIIGYISPASLVGHLSSGTRPAPVAIVNNVASGTLNLVADAVQAVPLADSVLPKAAGAFSGMIGSLFPDIGRSADEETA